MPDFRFMPSTAVQYVTNHKEVAMEERFVSATGWAQQRCPPTKQELIRDVLDQTLAFTGEVEQQVDQLASRLFGVSQAEGNSKHPEPAPRTVVRQTADLRDNAIRVRDKLAEIMGRLVLAGVCLAGLSACSLHNTSCTKGADAACHVEVHADWNPSCNGSCAKP